MFVVRLVFSKRGFYFALLIYCEFDKQGRNTRTSEWQPVGHFVGIKLVQALWLFELASSASRVILLCQHSDQQWGVSKATLLDLIYNITMDKVSEESNLFFYLFYQNIYSLTITTSIVFYLANVLHIIASWLILLVLAIFCAMFLKLLLVGVISFSRVYTKQNRQYRYVKNSDNNMYIYQLLSIFKQQVYVSSLASNLVAKPVLSFGQVGSFGLLFSAVSVVRDSSKSTKAIVFRQTLGLNNPLVLLTLCTLTSFE